VSCRPAGILPRRNRSWQSGGKPLREQRNTGLISAVIGSQEILATGAPQPFGDMHKAGHRSHAHLFHYACAMNLHSLFNDIQVARYLLVEPATDHMQHDLAFAKRQCSPLPRQFRDVLALPECLYIGGDSGFDCGE